MRMSYRSHTTLVPKINERSGLIWPDILKIRIFTALPWRAAFCKGIFVMVLM